MRKSIITIIIIIIIVGVGYLIYQSILIPEEENKMNIKNCEVDSDCLLFGESGDCNCGCFNKDYQWEKEGDCFCAAPKSCKCIDGKCEGVFEEEKDSPVNKEENKVIFSERKEIAWKEYTCSNSEKLAEENQSLYDVIIQGDGLIEKNCQIVLGWKDCDNLHETINISYIDLTNDEEEDAIVVFKGSIMFRDNIVGVFWLKEGNYLKILDEALYEGEPFPKLEDNQLVKIDAIYLPGDAMCCPSNHAHVYYKFTGQKLEVDRVVDDYGQDITGKY